jgi:2-keto-4-pentenoate hydratase/2-oxohepta-3-ene-1,7-dioic acid hydratase in catechol pathway
MRFVTCLVDGAPVVAVEADGAIQRTPFTSLVDLIASGERPALGDAVSPERMLAPIPRPGKILGSGVNFKNHLDENPNGVLPNQPFFFSKLPSSVIGPDEEIVIDSPDRRVDYEVELGVVIGKPARGIDEAHAFDHVFGYTVVHDVSARDIQFVDSQVTIGKGLDTFCPLGPAVVTTDEIDDVDNLRLRTELNGEVMQDGSTTDWLFSIPYLISYLSSYFTLEPGDIVTTGTPAGVGCFRNPERYLVPGDVVTVEVENVGRLTNRVVAGY